MKAFNRWFYAAMGVVVLLFAGMVYAWSILSAPISREYPHWLQGELSLTFTIVMIMFCVGCMTGGALARKVSARVCIWTAGVLFLAGFVLAARIHSLMGLYLSFGVACGFGSGFAYTAVLGTVGKWFPDKQGLISGILLMGFGISSFLVGKLYQAFTPDVIGAWRHSFTVFGVVSVAALIVCGTFIRKPGQDFAPPLAAAKAKRYVNPVAREATAAEMLRTPQFWLYYVWVVLLSAAGLALVSQAGGIARGVGSGVSAGTIATVVGLISVANGVGRVIMGGLFDKVGRSKVMQIVNIGFIITGAVLATALTTRSFSLLIAGFLLGGLSYGGVNPTNSAFISSYFGMKNYALNFSIINTNLLISSFGSTIAGVLYDLSESYMSTYLMICVLAVLGILASAAISVCDKRQLSGRGNAPSSEPPQSPHSGNRSG